MRRYLLAAIALFYASFLAYGCASIRESSEGVIAWEAQDEDLDSLTIEAIYYSR